MKFKKLLIIFSIVVGILFNVVYSLPSVSLAGATQVENNVYYADRSTQNPQPIYIQVNNIENNSYEVRLTVSGTIPMVIKYGATVVGSGTTFSTSRLVIYPNSQLLLTMEFLSPPPGITSSTILFEFFNTTNTTQIVGSSSVILRVNFTSPQTQQTGGEQVSQPSNQNTQQYAGPCLAPFRSKIKKTMLVNETVDITLGVINQCNTTLELVDVDIEGLPSSIARIKDAQLGTLGPSQIQYIKLTIDTHNVKSPIQLSFDVIFTGKVYNKVENAITNVELLVLSPQQFTTENVTKQEIPQGLLPLNVDYSIDQGYLIIRGAYIEYNNTKIYVESNIQVLSDGSSYTYIYPIKLDPGKTYCISAQDINKKYIPYFKCFTISKRPLCLTLSPEGKKYLDVLYYNIGTNVTISRVYDCDTLSEIKEYKILYDGSLTERKTFSLNDDNIHTITIKADGYNDYTVKIRGYKEVEISGIPNYIGNYTIYLTGTFADQATLEIYRIVNGTKENVYTLTGAKNEVSFNESGTYIFVLKAPLQDNKEFKVYIAGPVVKEEKSLYQLIMENMYTILFYAAVAFIIFTLISYLIYRKVTRKSLSEAAKEIYDLVNK